MLAADEVPPEGIGDAPLTAEEMIESGRQAFVHEDFEIAKERFENFVEVFGQEAEAGEALALVRPLLALCYVRLRAFEAAAEAIDQALKEDDLPTDLRLELLFWQGVCGLQAGEPSKAQESFLRYLEHAGPKDPRRVEAAVLYGNGYLLEDRHAEAVAFFEKTEARYADGGASPDVLSRFVMLHLHALLQLGDVDRALALVKREIPRFASYIQVVGLQSLVLDLGSRLLEEQRCHDAIDCLHQVWSRERILDLQTSRLDQLNRRILAARVRGNADALVFQLQNLHRRIEREVEQFRALTEFDAGVRMRLARAYLGLESYREAALVLEDIIQRMEPTSLVEGAFVSLMQCWMEERRWSRAVATADRYVTLFGWETDKAPRAPTILFLKGRALQEARRHDEAIAGFDALLERFPDSPMAPNAFFMRGICHLQSERHAEAIAVFKAFDTAYPDHAVLRESALYWRAMAHSFHGDHTACLTVIRRHLKTYPHGHYHVDARFREAFSLHALADYEAAIARFASFLSSHQDSAYADEARLLLGDAQLAIGELDAGLRSYASIRPESTRFFEDGYFKTGKAFRLSERFDEMQSHFQQFTRLYPDSARLPEALHWLGWLHSRNGLVEEARALYWKAVREHGDDPEKTSLEDLMLALNTLYATPEERAGLENLWTSLRDDARANEQRLLELRCLWARAAAIASAAPVRAKALLLEAGPTLDLAADPPRLLADVAEAERAFGDPRRAESIFEGIVKWHPNALERDLADFGLGELASGRGDHDEALRHFERMIKRDSGHVLSGEARLESARCHRHAGRTGKAMEALHRLLEDQAVPGSAKAKALVQAGRWLVEEGEVMQALVYFERVYIAYGGFLPEVAAAYEERAQALESVGEESKAKELYAELVSREDLKELPQYRRARERLGNETSEDEMR